MSAAALSGPANHAARFGLCGRRALVTGAAQGIGLAIARGLAAAGAAVVLADRDPKVAAAAQALRADGHDATAAVADVTVEADVDSLFAMARDGPDILVNNAAVILSKPATELGRADWGRVIDVNLTACFFLAQTAARRMAAGGGGAIVNLGSIVGRQARRGLSAYIAAKAGIDGLTRALACDFAGTGIRVNAVAPGFIVTAMSQTGSAAFEERIGKAVPLRRWGRPEDIADAAVFLASDAASYINGQTLVVDGGFTAVST